MGMAEGLHMRDAVKLGMKWAAESCKFVPFYYVCVYIVAMDDPI